MKTKLIPAIAFFLAMAGDGAAAAFMVDSFSNGAFSLSGEGETFNIDVVPGNPMTRTRVRVRVTGRPDWTAVSTEGSGVMNYTMAHRSGTIVEGTENWIELFYGASSGTRLLGTDALVLRVTGLTGLGEVTARFSPSLTNSVPVSITGTGDLIYPFSNIPGARGEEFDLSTLVIRIQAKSADFSVTLDEISVVPEASSVLLLGLGGAWLAGRRRRGTPGGV